VNTLPDGAVRVSPDPSPAVPHTALLNEYEMGGRVVVVVVVVVVGMSESAMNSKSIP
jgi:hypothetical protein